jgi:ribosome-binding protein aMBF1 (putative translation factor)
MKALEVKKETKIYFCLLCGKEVSGDHIVIKTRRKSEIHIDNHCMNEYLKTNKS